jgi:hypothetical protein
VLRATMAEIEFMLIMRWRKRNRGGLKSFEDGGVSHQKYRGSKEPKARQVEEAGGGNNFRRHEDTTTNGRRSTERVKSISWNE